MLVEGRCTDVTAGLAELGHISRVGVYWCYNNNQVVKIGYSGIGRMMEWICDFANFAAMIIAFLS